MLHGPQLNLAVSKWQRSLQQSRGNRSHSSSLYLGLAGLKDSQKNPGQDHCLNAHVDS